MDRLRTLKAQSTMTRLQASRAQAARFQQPRPEIRMTSAHDLTLPRLGGGEIALSEFAGKAILVVNVASACGLTPQYRDLEALWQAKKAAGLIVVGVPCNDFGGQEPGDDAEIKGFCETNYNVTFPLAGKVEILNRDRRHPFYKWIAAQVGEEALPRWNFHKYLIGKDGALEGAFASATPPLGVDIVGAVEKTLSA
jgi:glutathione peroxidase